MKSVRELLVKGIKEPTTPLAQAMQRLDQRPSGKNDSGGRWYPSKEEEASCCASIRSPSRNFPGSLFTHCRSIKHIACLFGISALNLKREQKRRRSVDANIQIPVATRLDPIARACRTAIRAKMTGKFVPASLTQIERNIRRSVDLEAEREATARRQAAWEATAIAEFEAEEREFLKRVEAWAEEQRDFDGWTEPAKDS